MRLVNKILKCYLGLVFLLLFFGNSPSCVYAAVGLIAVALVGLFVVVPLAFHWVPGLMRSFIFVPQDEIPANTDYKHPESLGFYGGRNLYLKTEDGATLGVWHTLPVGLGEMLRDMNSTEENVEEEFYDKVLSNATVFLYLHGSAGSRTSSHRLRVYRLLNQLGYHLVTFDYRGYGDSTLHPRGEKDLITDTTTVYSWLKQRVTTGRIFLWGHSLGTGVAAHFSNSLKSSVGNLSGIVLEAPFSSMEDELRVNRLVRMVSFLPWFDFSFIEPLYKYDLSFTSDLYLETVPTQILILHARDDNIVPYTLAEKLYNKTKQSRKDPESVELILYESSLKYGHYNIALDPGLNSTIRHFVQSSEYEDLDI